FCPFVSNYMDVPNVPLYPFGYGLSYGEIEYSEVSLDKDVLTENVLESDGTAKELNKIIASVTVFNKGNRAVKEAVQLYIRDIKGSVVRPLRELKGLKKVEIQPGEKKTVEFEITEEMLRFYDVDMNFVSEPGDFMVWIGHDSMTDNGAGFRMIK
ncbi:MAG: fibronectin type III-like domain-contianing protein, partial [Lachnospiraceae bacterium]|nr:fibronectin type III-like domain-contianing protein [Lachnospiraceae bacterium]